MLTEKQNYMDFDNYFNGGWGVALINKCRAALLSLVFIAVLQSVYSPYAVAQSDDESEETEDQGSGDKVKADFKGIIGLGLIGAELGFVIPAVAGLNETWAFIIFPIVGAAGGGVAGYFLLEKGDKDPELAVASLALGMALIIPATVISLSATSYDPDDEPTKEMPTEASIRISRISRREIQKMARDAGPGLLRWSNNGVFLGAPGITTEMDSCPEGNAKVAAQKLKTRTLRVSLFSGRF